jgi:hypothetical protein
MPEDMPEHIAEDMPGRVAEDMPDTDNSKQSIF